jgi:hypothetical protein
LPISTRESSLVHCKYEEIDVGETTAVHCVRRALWLARHGRLPFALVVGQAVHYGMPSGTNIEVAVPPGERGAELVRHVLDNIESRVRSASSYRGKVLSLEAAQRYTGAMGPIRVHKLKHVTQDQLVLPPKTIALLDRNVIGFVAQREKLKSLGLPVKKGLLFYGPPGTGKTHTIHYLATRLADPGLWSGSLFRRPRAALLIDRQFTQAHLTSVAAAAPTYYGPPSPHPRRLPPNPRARQCPQCHSEFYVPMAKL